jgi:hypothetical protein
MRKHGVRAAAVAAAACLSLTGCGIPSKIGDVVDNGDSVEDRAEALDSVYAQGKEARKSMGKLGLIVDETSCTSAFVTSGAKDAENDMNGSNGNYRATDVNFQELRKLSFVNGCMDRPNTLPAVTAPSLQPTSSASPSTSKAP